MYRLVNAAFIAGLAMHAVAGSAQAPRIVVEPDFLASRDGEHPLETHVAANPRRVGNLIAGSITHTGPNGTPATKVYATVDGGRSWTDVAFPEQRSDGGGDPEVAFTPHGTALFATLNIHPDESGRTQVFLHLYRSEDGGLTWSRPADLGASYDHEMLTVDRTTGRYAGACVPERAVRERV
ncbi:MAG: sialidase family protein [Gemmatimonadaceae bacterium]